MQSRFFAWLWHQPYLLLSLTALFWAGNAIVARAIYDGFTTAVSEMKRLMTEARLG